MLVEIKKPAQSKTIIFNAAVFIAILGYIATLLVDPSILVIIPPHVLPYISAVVVAINIGLRFLTVNPISPNPFPSEVKDKLED